MQYAHGFRIATAQTHLHGHPAVALCLQAAFLGRAVDDGAALVARAGFADHAFQLLDQRGGGQLGSGFGQEAGGTALCTQFGKTLVDQRTLRKQAAGAGIA